LDEAVVAEFFQFLDAQAGGAKDFHSRPGPKTAVLFEGEVATLAGLRVVGPDLGAGVLGGDRAAQSLASGGELRSEKWSAAQFTIVSAWCTLPSIRSSDIAIGAVTKRGSAAWTGRLSE
jgi:hypothetical protein